MAQGKLVDFVLINKASGRQISSSGNRIDLKSPMIVKLVARREEVKDIVRDGDSLVVQFDNGDALTIEHFFRDDSSIPSDLVFEDRDNGALWHWTATGASADGLVPLQSTIRRAPLRTRRSVRRSGSLPMIPMPMPMR